MQLAPTHGSLRRSNIRTEAAFDYTKEDQIGSGTYGVVWKAKDKVTGEVVALKKIRMENEKEGFPITAIREIKILQSLNHENVVSLKEIVASEDKREALDTVFLVFEYLDHDLAGLLDSGHFKATLTTEHIKCYMRQLFEGLHYLHQNNILHRDIKAANLLISNKGVLKLADFGLARPIYLGLHESAHNYTNKVVTLWYRAPELLLGETHYNSSIDMWSAGCVFVDFLTRKPLFPGNKTELEQIGVIWALLGTPTEENWPNAKNLLFFSQMAPARSIPSTFRKKFESLPAPTLELLEKLLALDPLKRISATDALDTDYFWTDPLPCRPDEIPSYPVHSHEFTSKNRKRKRDDAYGGQGGGGQHGNNQRGGGDSAKRYKGGSQSWGGNSNQYRKKNLG